MDVDLNKVAQDCIDSFQKQVKDLKRLNIVVVGKSGVGKSTLINSLFRDNFAKTGLGRPVTSEIRRLEKKTIHLLSTTPQDLSFLMTNRQRLSKGSSN